MTDGRVCCGCIVVHPDDDVELNVAAGGYNFHNCENIRCGSVEIVGLCILGLVI